MPRAGLATKTIRLIEEAEIILREIQPATVRGVCYKLFVRGLIPDMSKNSTNRVGTALVTAREQGRIPWHWIVDEHRSIEQVATWENPAEIVEETIYAYRKDYWQDQPYRVVVVSEKGTVRGVIKRVLNEMAVEFLALHGYGSATVLHDLAEQSQQGKPSIFLYIGDFDPSGKHMSDIDLPGRIERYGGKVHISRIALTEGDRSKLPGFSADTKSTDARYQWFVSQYGTQCTELDALDPNELRERIRESIREWVDLDRWEQSRSTEEAEKQSLYEVISSWRGIFSGQPENRSEGAA